MRMPVLALFALALMAHTQFAFSAGIPLASDDTEPHVAVDGLKLTEKGPQDIVLNWNPYAFDPNFPCRANPTYSVYRGESEDFIPIPSDRIARHLTTTNFRVHEPLPNHDYYYQVLIEFDFGCPSSPEWTKPTNIQGSATLHEKAENGDAIAQFSLGSAYYWGEGVPQDYAQAVIWIRKAAEQRNANAEYRLGFMYANGEGVSKDDSQAVIWWSRAAAQGNAEAQTGLGFFYRDGTGVPKDNVQAVQWFRKAAEQGEVFAELNLGSLYYDGEGVAQDYAQAVIWYRKAAVQGMAEAQFYLGSLYDQGKGVPQDYSVAAQWYLKGAEQGDASSQMNLGVLYARGQGVPQDYAEAYLWFDLAAASNLDIENAKAAAKDRDQAASHLSPADLTRVQEQARKWFEDHPARPQ